VDFDGGEDLELGKRRQAALNAIDARAGNTYRPLVVELAAVAGFATSVPVPSSTVLSPARQPIIFRARVHRSGAKYKKCCLPKQPASSQRGGRVVEHNGQTMLVPRGVNATSTLPASTSRAGPVRLRRPDGVEATPSRGCSFAALALSAGRAVDVTELDTPSRRDKIDAWTLPNKLALEETEPLPWEEICIRYPDQ